MLEQAYFRLLGPQAPHCPQNHFRWVHSPFVNLKKNTGTEKGQMITGPGRRRESSQLDLVPRRRRVLLGWDGRRENEYMHARHVCGSFLP